jgi:hypothetical protein
MLESEGPHVQRTRKNEKLPEHLSQAVPNATLPTLYDSGVSAPFVPSKSGFYKPRNTEGNGPSTSEVDAETSLQRIPPHIPITTSKGLIHPHTLSSDPSIFIPMEPPNERPKQHYSLESLKMLAHTVSQSSLLGMWKTSEIAELSAQHDSELGFAHPAAVTTPVVDRTMSRTVSDVVRSPPAVKMNAGVVEQEPQLTDSQATGSIVVQSAAWPHFDTTESRQQQ